MRKISPEALEFASLLQPGDGLAWGQAAAEPLTLTRALMAQRQGLSGIHAFCGIGWADTLDPAYTDALRFTSYCGTARNRLLQAAGQLDILPVHYSGLEAALAPRVDVLLIQIAEGRIPGTFSFSLACEYLAPLVKSARLVIAELNSQAPSTPGMVTITRDEIDILVPVCRALPLPPEAKGDAVQARIAERIAALIPEGAILQVGLGALPEAILSRLHHHRHLGLHSGLFTEGMAGLIHAGVVDNSTKAAARGVSVTGLITGGEAAWALAQETDLIRLAPTSYTHALPVLAALPKLVAINAGLEVDLTGQVNSEVAAGAYVGAIGGGTDFARGAAASAGGLPLLALPSARRGRDGRLISAIVPALGGPVSLSRADAGVIVTEEGVADLRGQPFAERALRLIRVAHPELREDLSREARDRGLLRPHHLRRD
ncbi:acetyl-CoA hydrolase/transferase family protein [Falsigemmobacter faecalis]|nr:acetyl-CoA hydrolase/transferase C-terminal domain-containing protein [Falsigemmobacter faecalis]